MKRSLRSLLLLPLALLVLAPPAAFGDTLNDVPAFAGGLYSFPSQPGKPLVIHANNIGQHTAVAVKAIYENRIAAGGWLMTYGPESEAAPIDRLQSVERIPTQWCTFSNRTLTINGQVNSDQHIALAFEIPVGTPVVVYRDGIAIVAATVNNSFTLQDGTINSSDPLGYGVASVVNRSMLAGPQDVASAYTFQGGPLITVCVETTVEVPAYWWTCSYTVKTCWNPNTNEWKVTRTLIACNQN